MKKVIKEISLNDKGFILKPLFLLSIYNLDDTVFFYYLKACSPIMRHQHTSTFSFVGTPSSSNTIHEIGWNIPVIRESASSFCSCSSIASMFTQLRIAVLQFLYHCECRFAMRTSLQIHHTYMLHEHHLLYITIAQHAQKPQKYAYSSIVSASKSCAV